MYCWWERIVVGHKYITWWLLYTVLNIALNATSVLPKPTSPHKSLSIGFVFFKSLLISFIALIWSFVKTYENSEANISSSATSLYASDLDWALSLYSFINFSDISFIFFLIAAFVLAHWDEFKWLSFGTVPSASPYLYRLLIFSTGT